MFNARSLFKFKIQNIPFVVGLLLLLILARRSQQNWQTLAEFVENRKYYDLIAVKNGISFIDKDPITKKEEIEKAVADVARGAHRNTVFILGESRFSPQVVVQPIHKFSKEEINYAEKVWADPDNHSEIYGYSGHVFGFRNKTYQAIATHVIINGTRFELPAFTSISRTIEKAYQKSLIELTILLGTVATIVLVVLTAASRAVTDHAKDILSKEKSIIKAWWPSEIKVAAKNYNDNLDAEKLHRIQIDQSTSGQMVVRSKGIDGGIIHAPNKALFTITGWTQAELEGAPLNLIVPEKYHQFHFGLGQYDHELGRRVGMAAYAQGCPFHSNHKSRIVGRDRTVDLLHKNGTICKVILGVFYVGKNDDGEDEWVGVLTDVTQLTDAIAKAETLAKDTQNITHIFAHDLKAGEIASAKAGEYVTETAKDLIAYLGNAGHLDQETERSLNFIAKYSSRITASCQNNFALIDQRNKLHDLKERIRPEPHSIEEIFDGVDISFNRSDGRLILVNGCQEEEKAMVDLTLFLSALKNLVKNGFTYNNSVDKFVEIRASVQDRQILFSIRDNGIGFPAEYLESWGQVQGQAARLDTAREGSGTGLYSVRRIIEAHKGATVEITSEQGIGSTFLILVGLEN